MPYDSKTLKNAPQISQDASKPQSGMEACVPLESLAMPAEDDKLANPAVGDPVTMHAEGKVTRIEGDMAYVKVESVNGKPMDAESAQKTDMPDSDGDNEFKQLESMAAQQPDL